MKRFLKRNIFNIIFAALLIMAFGGLSTLEFEGEKGQGHLKESIQTVYAMEAEECTAEYVPSVQEMIVNACKDYGIPSDLALAIARLETGNYTSAALLKGNNVGGLKEKRSGEWITMDFNTLDDGVGAFVRTLSNIGTADVDRLATIYCPHNPTGWAATVKEILKK